MNMIQGSSLRAIEKSEDIIFSDCPDHLLTSADEEILMRAIPLLLAIIFASIVFPVPGGP